VSGRVGTSNFVNKKRTFIIPESFVEEEDRQRQLNKVFQKLRDFEEDRPSTTSSSTTSGSSFNKTTTGPGSGNGGSAGFFAGTASGSGGFQRGRENECIQFKNIKENQMVSTHSNFSSGGAGYHGGSKSYHIENSELLFKMLRFDNKLLR
jgi:hypothetical protein